MFLTSPKIFLVYHSLLRIIQFSLNFIQLFILLRTCAPRKSCSREHLRRSLHFLVDHSPIKRSNSSNLPISIQEVPAVHSLSLPDLPSSSSSSLDLALWHNRLGHPTLDVVKSTLNSCNIPFVSMNDQSPCHPCFISKAHKLSYSLSNFVSDHPLELIHSDLCGSSPVISRNGFACFVSFIDHFSRFTWIYLLKNKSDVSSVFKQFKSMSENHFGLIKTL